MDKKNIRNIAILAGIAVVVFGLVFGVIMITQNAGKKPTEISEEKAMDRLNKLYGRLSVDTADPIKGNVDLDPEDQTETLPDISKYPPQVQNTTPDYVEIFSSTEKAGEGSDAWLVDMARAFNENGVQVDGKNVSVRLRGIPSGLGTDYIASGKYLPEAFSPSNELWGKMLADKGVAVNLVEKRLTGNVAGVLFTKQKQDELIQKYGAINLKNITEAVTNDNLAMGYTNPFASSAGLNFLLSTLCTFDNKDPLSETAVSEFQKFQTNIPFVAYTTLQMRESAKSGALDGFILEYQSYSNLPDIKSEYIFTPYGVRHDSPVYEIGSLSREKKEILKQFIDFCKTPENQDMASQYGFNNLDDYQYELGEVKDDVVTKAQKLYKEKKGGGKTYAAVFVADVSGSMEGDPMLRLKESLIQGSKSIGNDNYIGLVTFSDGTTVNLPLGKFDLNQRSLFTGAVDSLQPSGGTAMFDGITVGVKMLTDLMEQDPGIKPMLFVLTDGETNRGFSLNDTKMMLEGLKVPIYTIGYNADIAVLETLSSINEAASINADTEDVVYQMQSLFNAQM